MTLAHWDEPEAPWDRLQLGPHVMPGIWEITSGECARQVDHKKTKDKDGARIHDMGLLPPRLSARGRMVTVEDWEMLQQIMPDIHPKKKGGIKFPLSIFHPAVAVLGVLQVYVERIRPPEIKDGVLEISLDMIEWSDQPKPTKIKNKVDPATDADVAIMVAQLRGAGQFSTSTLQAANISYDPPARTFDEDFALLTGSDTRHPPEFSAAKSIDPTSR
jgi:hypothetical protein